LGRIKGGIPAKNALQRQDALDLPEVCDFIIKCLHKGRKPPFVKLEYGQARAKHFADAICGGPASQFRLLNARAAIPAHAVARPERNRGTHAEFKSNGEWRR
jgi:hypothetical protein